MAYVPLELRAVIESVLVVLKYFTEQLIASGSIGLLAPMPWIQLAPSSTV